MAARDVPCSDRGAPKPSEGQSKAQKTDGQETAALESALLYRESNIPKWRFAFLCVGVSLGLFLAMIDSSIVATSLFTIATDFEEAERINWVALAYTLAFVGCSVFFARIADIIGRRDAFLVAFFIFFSFSLGCGFSNSLNTLAVCRTFQGIGGAGLFSVTMIILPEVAPENLRNSLAPIIGMVISMAGVLGPVLGGALTHSGTGGWRWIFWINGPVGFISMALFFLSWPPTKYLPTIERRSWKHLDFVGSFLVIAAAVLVTFAFQNAGTDQDTAGPWAKGSFVGPLVAGLVCWVAVFIWERIFEHFWSSKMAAVPLVLYRSHVFTCTSLSTMFLGFAFLATLYAVPLRLQVVNQQSSIMAGVWMLPMLAATGMGSIVTGALSKKKDRLAETMTVATIMVTLGLALETTVSDSERLEPKFIGFLVLVGLGYGMITSAATIFTTLEAPIAEHAPAQGMIAQARMLGGSIGIAMTTALLAAHQRNGGLLDIVSPADLNNLAGGMKNLTDSQQAVIRNAYNGTFTETMKICAIVASFGVMLTMGTFRRGRTTLTGQRAGQVREEIARRQMESEQKGPVSSKSSGRSA
ncbi:unnamed protein product [Discula destructiva]